MNALKYHLRRVLDLDSFLSRFGKIRHIGVNSQGVDNWSCKCPAHDTNHESAVVGVNKDGRYLVYCHAGCTEFDILAAVGLSVSDLYPDGAMAERIAPMKTPAAIEIHRAVIEIAEDTRKRGERLSAADRKRERDAWLSLKKDTSWPKKSVSGRGGDES